MVEKKSNILWHEATVQKEQRQKSNAHKSCVIWFTGLSGAGKSTLANALDLTLFDFGMKTYVLDGDNIRHGLNKDLCFSNEDRKENIRRIGEVAKLFVGAGTIVSTAFISPFQEDRNSVREILEVGEFIEVFVKCGLDECERRDVKGFYKKARSGTIPSFTGISSPYEEPERPELVIDTEQKTIEESVQKVLSYLRVNGIIH
ncbi:adenylyl-sulfate kinase [Shouchella shacheensis]|uniref:adenylyl-sulfate kinase n=1 Tax=Shouchella shacheensis TaxID=1649580 RepID=UPI0007402D51|nr:adenylyl-sulfate kinase [Shouchella shacheensis]